MDGTCYSCPNNCQACSNSSICQQCLTGYQLTEDNSACMPTPTAPDASGFPWWGIVLLILLIVVVIGVIGKIVVI